MLIKNVNHELEKILSLKCWNFHSSCWRKSTLTSLTMMRNEIRQVERRNAFAGARELQLWHLILAAALTKQKKKREQDEHSEINKNICVRDFEICYFSPHRWNKIFNLWANFTQKQNESFSRSKSEKNREIICRRGEKCFSNFSALFRR